MVTAIILIKLIAAHLVGEMAPDGYIFERSAKRG